MDVALVIRQRLDELDLDQRDLARAANVTESYVSQILSRKKAPPAPERTDIYDRMDRFLKLPHGELARVAGVHLKEERKRRLGEVAPLLPDLRALILRKWAPDHGDPVRAIIEQQSFGELERLVAGTLLHVARLGSDVLHVTPKQRARLDSAIESAKVAAQRLQEKTVAAAKATDECIRTHPYQTLGVAFGLGLLIGVLVGRRRD